MKQKRVHPKYCPPRLPVWSTLITWLLLDRLHPSGVVWGVVGTLVVIFWIAWALSMWNTTYCAPILEKEKE